MRALRRHHRRRMVSKARWMFELVGYDPHGKWPVRFADNMAHRPDPYRCMHPNPPRNRRWKELLHEYT